MNEQEQRIAIAEWYGYEVIQVDYETYEVFLNGKPLDTKRRRLYDSLEQAIRHEYPHYPNDLNAMHEAEKKLDMQDKITYVRILHPRGGDSIMADFVLMHKLANERSEALCRTLWPERFENK